MSVTWLHISDFHFRAGDTYDRDVVLRALVASVRRYREKGRRADLVFATGDIAHSGQPAEYAAATRFFDDLLQALELPRDRLFVVPGNHDVDRRLGVGLARTLETLDQCNTYFDPATVKPHIALKLGAFKQWFDHYFQGIRAFPDTSTCAAVETLQIHGQALAVLPLNSALFCLDDADHAQLLLGRRCLDPALAQLRAAGDALKIVLLHHPLDWLGDIERSNVRAALHAHADVILRGHLHETDVETVVAATGRTLHIAAGSAYQTRAWPNRAYYATLTEERQLRLFPIRYEDKPVEVWTTDPSLFPDDPGHERSLALGGTAPPAPAAAAPTAPAAAPARAGSLSNVAARGNTPFLGRDDLLARMAEILADAGTEGVLVLHGPPGVGKSELAREYARGHAARYPGGRFVVQGGSELVDLAKIGTNLLGLPFAPGLSLADQCEQTLRHLQGRQALIVFDNPASPASIADWLPRSGTALHAIVTTTNERWGDGWHALAVAPLPDATALALVQALGGAEVARKVGPKLVALAGGLPMQLVPAARALAYEERRARLDRAAVKLTNEAAGSFDVAVRHLPPPARLVLHAAAFLSLQRILPDEVFHHVEPLLDGGRTEFDRLVDQCVDLHLLEGQHELRMHQLLADYLADRLVKDLSDADLDTLKHRRADRLATLCREVGSAPADANVVGPLLTYPVSYTPWRGTRFETETGDQQWLGSALSTIGRFEEARPWYERAAAGREREDAQGQVNHEALGNSLHQVGYCLSSLGRFEEAHGWCKRAVAQREQGDVQGRVNHEGLGSSLHQIGFCLSGMGRFDEAQPWYKRAAGEREQGDLHGRVDHEGLGNSLHQVGFCLSSLGHFDEARDWYERAVAERERGDVHGRINHEGLGTSLHQVGFCLSSVGRFDEAQPWYARAVSEREQGDVHGRVDHERLGSSLHQVGFCLSSVRRFDEAQPWYTRAVTSRERGDVHGRINHEGLGTSVHQVGFCLSSLKRFTEAQPWHERAVNERQQGDLHGRVNHEGLGNSLHLVGFCLSSVGRFEEAQPWYERAVAAREQGDMHERINHEGLGISLHQVGFCLLRLGRHVQAQAWYERAVTARQLGDVYGRVDHQGLGSSLHQVGLCLAKQGRPDDARPWYERALAEKAQGDVHGRVDPASVTATLRDLVEACEQSGHPEEAARWRAKLEAPGGPAQAA